MPDNRIPMFMPRQAAANTAEQNLDIDREMWSGATVPRRIADPRPPLKARQPDVPPARQPPPSAPGYPPMVVKAICPPWQCPGIYSTPFMHEQNTCVPWYEVSYPIFQWPVDTTRMVVLTHVSYEVEQAKVSNGDIFEVSVLRDGQPLAVWEEYVIDNAAANPAERYAFAGHALPVPVVLPVDANHHLTIAVKMRGSFPFTKTDADGFNGNVKIITNGYTYRLRDTRQGAPKYLTDGMNETGEQAKIKWVQDLRRYYTDLNGAVI